METDYLQNVKFKTLDSTFPSSDINGIRYPFIGIALGAPGQGKSYIMAQYAKHSIQLHDYDGMFALCKQYSENGQYFDHIPNIMDAFPQEHIKDSYKVFAWLEHIAKWNTIRMNAWRKVKLQYPKWEDYKNSKENFNEFVITRETKFIPLDLESIAQPIKKKTKKEKNNNNEIKNVTSIESPTSSKYSLDYHPWRQYVKINNNIAGAEKDTNEIMKKVKR